MFTPLVVFYLKVVVLHSSLIGNPIGFGIGGFQVVYTHIGIEHSTVYIYICIDRKSYIFSLVLLVLSVNQAGILLAYFV